MSILQELNTLLSPILPVETGIFSGIAPDEYLVLTPMITHRSSMYPRCGFPCFQRATTSNAKINSPPLCLERRSL